MNRQDRIVKGVLSGLAMLIAISASGQRIIVNQWRGDENGADWNNKYKWKRMHTPEGEEQVHFRDDASVVTVNSTVYLNNGMYLYGRDLSLVGNGNINLRNPVAHQQTVNIPASAEGFANLTLNDNLSLNGRLALAVKGFGTSACKGSVTLKDRSSVTGVLAIGKQGIGTGQVFVKGNSIYRITGLELATSAKKGGSAEIHVLGGTVRIETRDNPFDPFLADPSRRLIVGDSGTVRIEHNLHASKKKAAVKKLIQQDRLVAAPGCRLLPPVIRNNMMIIRAEDQRNENAIKTKKALLAAIDKIPVKSVSTTIAKVGNKPKLESLLQNMTSNSPATAAKVAKVGNKPKLESLMQNMKSNSPATAAGSEAKPAAQTGTKMAGYIVFFGTVLLALRRSSKE